MLPIDENNIHEYLRERNWFPEGILCVEPLSGGVSNIVLRINTPKRTAVFKQSRGQLRTRDDWFSDLDRIYREQEVMQMLHPLLPAETVPEILFVDRPNFAFVMSHAPLDATPWKQQLLDGKVDLTIGKRAGTYLGRIHQATADNHNLVEPFRDHTVFVQLRADPFYQRVRERRPEVADVVANVIVEMLACKEALCHGDYTPKNMLVHADGFTLVDYETACFGDPTMDIGLFLCHLILKAVHRPQQRNEFFELTRQFWQGYGDEVRFRSVANLQARGLRHLAVCLLARVDGTSPIDYVPDERQRDVVRRVAKTVLRDKIETWDDLLDLCANELTPLAG